MRKMDSKISKAFEASHDRTNASKEWMIRGVQATDLENPDMYTDGIVCFVCMADRYEDGSEFNVRNHLAVEHKVTKGNTNIRMYALALIHQVWPAFDGHDIREARFITRTSQPGMMCVQLVEPGLRARLLARLQDLGPPLTDKMWPSRSQADRIQNQKLMQRHNSQLQLDQQQINHQESSLIQTT